jgi:hypothetical protein
MRRDDLLLKRQARAFQSAPAQTVPIQAAGFANVEKFR